MTTFKRAHLSTLILMISSALLLLGTNHLNATAGPPADSVTWLDYQQGVAAAKQTGKPMLVFFYRNTCPFCQEVLSSTLKTDTSTIQYINANFVPIHVDIESKAPMTVDNVTTTEARFAYVNWSMSSVPCMWLLESNGCRIKKLRGMRACKKVLASLQEVHDHTYGDCPNAPLVDPKPAPKITPAAATTTDKK